MQENQLRRRHRSRLHYFNRVYAYYSYFILRAKIENWENKRNNIRNTCSRILEFSQT